MFKTLFLFAPMILIFYFIIIRPQQKQQKQHKQMLNEIKKNDEVVTTGGIHGTVMNVKETTFTLRIDENVKIEINKNAVTYLKKQHETT
ncbi:MAG: preprotein translocase subunit YajC [Candidatus Omnitrophica bacterium]|nr:preprotein translocase subunit YajC [Candidatus Omnitrophota bacterium]